jgi:hypothetical protein
MALPEIIATVTVPERESSGRRPYEIFRGLILENLEVAHTYTLTKGTGHFDEHGAFVLEDTGHVEHIHRYDDEKQTTGQLLASIRTEQRFGERYYIMEIYDSEFARFVGERWGHVDHITPRRREEEGVERVARR